MAITCCTPTAGAILGGFTAAWSTWKDAPMARFIFGTMALI